MYQYNNPHPQGKRTTDCLKRAITLATGKPYLKVKKELNDLKKITGCKAFNENKNWKEYVKRQPWEKLSFPAEAGKPRMNGQRFCDQFKTGSYILRMAGHLTAVINGVINDIWDCSEKCVYNAWKVS